MPGEHLHADLGAAGAWHRIRKLGTTASILHVTAHPDDEHAGMLTLASRGWGTRTALLSLNRGEAGANAIGTELFDALGLIRTRELVLSGRYYGLDDLYFTTALDYGYSKSVDEAFRSWDREAVLEDMVRVIRLNRPLVVVSRFHGSERDGHGNHHAAGVLTPEAVAAAADPRRFPDQISREGLRPWQALRVYRGGVAAGEPFHVQIDAGGRSPHLGASYAQWGSLGVSLQRSQTSGRVRRAGAGVRWYEMLAAWDTGAAADAGVAGPGAPQDGQPAPDFFAGLDTRLGALPARLGEAVAPEVAARLAAVGARVEAVSEDFDFNRPQASVDGLADGLALLRALPDDLPPELRFHLAVKERQFEDAILAAAGVGVRAELQYAVGGAVGGPAGGVAGGARGAVLVPGDEVRVRVGVESAVPDEVEVRATRVLVNGSEAAGGRVPLDAATARPYFSRRGIDQNHYSVNDSSALHLPWSAPQVVAEVQLGVRGVAIQRAVPVTGAVPRLPYGVEARRVEVLPAVLVTAEPRVLVVPAEGAGERPIEVGVRIEAGAPDLAVETRLALPAGWSAAPALVRHDFRSRGESARTLFTVRPPPAWSGDARLEAVAKATVHDAEREYRTGYQTIDHRDLPLARLHLPAFATVRAVEVAALDGVEVGYVMGVGDEVPAAIEALGATVRLLDEDDLAGGALDRFDAIVVGTRAYAVRRDLVEHNQRLLDYADRGGNVVVLYQTQEFVPGEMAPFPASLPRSAEEVSEEDAPVRLLAPSHPLLTTPNRIAETDFAGWLEQRGSKFFTEWDAAYTPLVETNDTGQAPQRGIWLTAAVGDGRYDYVALALHRQLPYGVPGAYRILSNLLWPAP